MDTAESKIDLTPIRVARLRKKLTIREAARRAGMEQGHWCRLEANKNPQARVTLLAVYRMARAVELRGLTKALEPFVDEITTEG